MVTVPRSLAVLAVAGALFAVADARADSTTEAAALKQFEEGRAAFEKGDFARALGAFSSSLQALPSPNTRLYIARCQRSLGKIGSAYTTYRRSAAEAADRLAATGEKRYSATRDAAQAEAAEIEATVPHLAVVLPPNAPANAVVTLDSVEMPKTALASLDVDPGPHALKVTAPRHVTFEKTVEVALRETKRVEVTLARLPTAAIELSFQEKPAGLTVAVDDRPLDPSAIERSQDLDVGAHRVIVRAPGYLPFEWKSSLVDGESRRVEVQLERDPSAGGGGTPKWLFFAVAGAAVVGLGIGTVFALDATSRSSDEKAKDPLERDPAEQTKIRSAATTANVLFVGGAAVAAGAVVLAFTTNWGSSKRASADVKAGMTQAPRRTVVSPWLSPTGAGVGAAGTF